jgi:diguanylate cyclase (GGDEF)-like protein
MDQGLPSDRLLAIIETQNEIATTALDLDAVMSLVVRRAQQLVGATAGVIELVDGEELVYHAASGSAEASLGLRLRADSSLSGLCVAHDEPLYCEDTRTDERVDRAACERVGAVSMVCVPLRYDGHVVGVLKVSDSERHAFSSADLETLGLLSGVIAAHMSHASQFQDKRRESGEDALTGLPNRRSFDERLATAAARARRHGSKIALCLLDLDRFKEVNDTHGHAAGDDVLRAVAAHLVTVRGEDAAYRIGGDEFALLLEETAEVGARQVARRLALAIRADPACDGVGASWGVAMVTGDPAESAANADAALYASKRAADSQTRERG